jgi:hypothetical protein
VRVKATPIFIITWGRGGTIVEWWTKDRDPGLDSLREHGEHIAFGEFVR